jgi:hypothetical protein
MRAIKDRVSGSDRDAPVHKKRKVARWLVAVGGRTLRSDEREIRRDIERLGYTIVSGNNITAATQHVEKFSLKLPDKISVKSVKIAHRNPRKLLRARSSSG